MMFQIVLNERDEHYAMSAHDIHCPPYEQPRPLARDDGRPPTILDYASAAAMAANRYQRAIDDGSDYRTVMRVSGMLARATHELTTAIADSVASGDGRLT